MSCCGKNRVSAATRNVRSTSDSSSVASEVLTRSINLEIRESETVSQPNQSSEAVYFECKTSPLIVIGAVTGFRYFFSEAGERLAVDARDRYSLLMINDLVEVG